MKKSLYIFLLIFVSSGFAIAQDGQKSIVDYLNTTRRGQGDIKVYQDESIKNLVAVYNTDTTTHSETGDFSTNYVRVRGFKIQVFSGNNQKKSKQEAESKQAQVRGAYPELEATITYNAPSWRLRVGNFLTREDAEEVLKDMKKTFPTFGREMYVVTDAVKRPANY